MIPRPRAQSGAETTVAFGPWEAFAERAERAFDTHRSRLGELLPAADIQHIGATAVPGALTKGDLDIQVRVLPADFADAEAVLARHYAPNEGSDRNPAFASFKDDDLDPPLGIQLTAMDSEEDNFMAIREALKGDSALLAGYNALKTAFEGRPMDEYRTAKSRFIDDLLALIRGREASGDLP